MRTLLDLGADVHAMIDRVGHTPMHYSCMYGLKEATIMLLEAGADAHMVGERLSCGHALVSFKMLLARLPLCPASLTVAFTLPRARVGVQRNLS